MPNALLYLDALLEFVKNREDEFNAYAERSGLGVYLRRGQLYPAVVGVTHTGRLGRELL